MGMAISGTIKAAAGVITSIGVIGGGAFALDARHAPASIVSDISVIQIFDLVETAQRDGQSDWICRAIEQQIAKLCSQDPEHYFCTDDDARDDIKAKAGCE